jgi:hypothetical protein
MKNVLMALFGINFSRPQHHGALKKQNFNRLANDAPLENYKAEIVKQHAAHDYGGVKVNWKQTIETLLADFVVNDEKYVGFLNSKYPDILGIGGFHTVFGNKENPELGVLKVFHLGEMGLYNGTEGANAFVHVYLQHKGIVPPPMHRPAILGNQIFVTSAFLPYMRFKLPKIGKYVPLTFEDPKINAQFYKLVRSMKQTQEEAGLYFRDSIFPTTQGNVVVENSANYGALKRDGQYHFYVIDVDGAGIDLNNQATLHDFDIDELIKERVAPQWTAEDASNSSAKLQLTPDGKYGVPEGGTRKRRATKMRSKITRARF